LSLSFQRLLLFGGRNVHYVWANRPGGDPSKWQNVLLPPNAGQGGGHGEGSDAPAIAPPKD